MSWSLVSIFWLWMLQPIFYKRFQLYNKSTALFFFVLSFSHCVILFKKFCWWHWFSAIRLQCKLIFLLPYTEIETNVIIPFILHTGLTHHNITGSQLLLKLQKFTKSCNHFHCVHLILFAIILSKETFLHTHTRTHTLVFLFKFNICSEVFQFR